MLAHSPEKWRLVFRRTFCSVRGATTQWWRKRIGTKSELSERERCGTDEVVHVSRDLGLSPPDLRTLANPGPGGANLLQRRMETLHLDPNELAQSDPFMLGDLQRLCTMCKSRGACALELEHASADVAWGEWREYCPNAVTLNELRIRSRMRFSPTVLK
jgi:hypothetical protein